jgi:hypothetical protein
VGLGAWAATKAWAVHCGVTSPAGLSCTENIRETKHNLAVNTDIVATGTTEVCVFCHTPHGGRVNVGGEGLGAGGAPLWNRALPPAGTTGTGGFTMYTSPNFDGAGDVSSGPKGVSLACLSCHDGVIALDALINAPGSGGFNSTNRDPLTGASPGAGLDGITFTGPGVALDGSLNDSPPDRPSTTDGGGFLGGAADYVGGPGMTPFPNLTRNLSDDHPISMRMSVDDPQFAEAILFSPAVGQIAPVKRFANAQLPTDKRDQVRLYNSDGTNIDYVECASCHNPHTPRTTFLRLPTTPASLDAPGNGDVTPITGASRNLNHEPNQGSLICLTCHQK